MHVYVYAVYICKVYINWREREGNDLFLKEQSCFSLIPGRISANVSMTPCISVNKTCVPYCTVTWKLIKVKVRSHISQECVNASCVTKACTTRIMHTSVLGKWMLSCVIAIHGGTIFVWFFIRNIVHYLYTSFTKTCISAFVKVKDTNVRI